MTGKTTNGFSYEIDDEALDDYDILQILGEIDSGEFQRIDELFNLLLGKEQKDALKEHIRKESKNGRVPMSAMMNALTEIFNSSADGKKS